MKTALALLLIMLPIVHVYGQSGTLKFKPSSAALTEEAKVQLLNFGVAAYPYRQYPVVFGACCNDDDKGKALSEIRLKNIEEFMLHHFKTRSPKIVFQYHSVWGKDEVLYRIAFPSETVDGCKGFPLPRLRD